MKLYSSTFISVIFAFLILLGVNNQPVEVTSNEIKPTFSTIFEPIATSLQGNRPFIEFFDSFNCKECNRINSETILLIKETITEKGLADLRIYVLPNNEAELQAVMGAKCAADQKQFWNMHSKLHETDDFSGKNIQNLAKELELDTRKFQTCLTEEKYRVQIETEMAIAKERDITSRPTIMINGFKLIGFQPIENVKKIVDDLRHDSLTQ